jgi:hypothetical protein
MSHTLRKTGIAILLGATLMLSSSISMQAQPDRRHRCERRIQKAEAALNRAIARHGINSRQAERRREELARVRAQCQGL